MKIFIPAVGIKKDIKIFEIQTLILPKGDYQVILTGNILDNISEEVNIVFSILRAYSNYFELDNDMLKQHDYHIHFSESQIIKEGESSGLGIFLSLIASIKGWNKAVNFFATGEIDLLGNILPMYNIENKLQINRKKYDYIFIPSAGSEKDKSSLESKIIRCSSVFEIYNFVKQMLDINA